ncbi:MAG TPA: PAS domain-containing protein, partial [Candidatus Omnitrophota bacterium]|nr:PAS domain-containing protein [Candidatus Omnitrophota bacterium]
MNWAVIVKRVREQHGLKQAAMAELLGVDQATVSRWECGQHIPALSVRNKLARMLAHTNTHNARLDERLADQPDAWVVDGAETLLASAYRRAPVGLCFMDTDLRYVFVNERLAAINGLPVQAHLGRQLAEVLGDLGQRLEPVYRQVLDSGAPIIEMEVSGSVPGYIGPSRYWAVSAYPVMAKGYRRLGLSVAVTDITDRKEVETGLRSVQESLLTAEARFRTVLNLSPAGFLLVKPIRGADDEI